MPLLRHRMRVIIFKTSTEEHGPVAEPMKKLNIKGATAIDQSDATIREKKKVINYINSYIINPLKYHPLTCFLEEGDPPCSLFSTIPSSL